MTQDEAVDILMNSARFWPLMWWTCTLYKVQHGDWPTGDQLRTYLLEGAHYDNIFVQEHTRRRRDRQPYRRVAYRRAYRRALDGWRAN